jgi:hypothetical protein
MTLNGRRICQLISLGFFIAAAGLTVKLIPLWTPAPELVVEITSTADSVAQVYYDLGHEFNEPDSITAPVKASSGFQELRFPLPRAPIVKLRFDPLMVAGTVTIRRMRILESGGKTVREFAPREILNLTDIRERAETPETLRLTTFDNAKDPAVYVPFAQPLEIAIPWPSARTLLRLIPVDGPLLILALVFWWSPANARIAGAVRALDTRFAAIGRAASSPRFIAFDSFAIWFYAGCAALFLVNVGLDLNGSSLEFNSRTFHQYGPQTVLAGTPKGIRADEWNFMTPDMFYQVFRDKRFAAEDTPFGKYYAGLMGNVPARHITTLLRPQYWGFFVLPVDYGFSFYWEMKWLLMVTGVFTLLLVLTGSSWLSAAGTVWLFFSPFTQWTYSWPSMLPEMCGTFCFIVVLAMYLTVGAKRWVLGVCAALLAMCLVNFALFAYVPHLLPYCWAGVFLFAGWLYARRERIFAVEDRGTRLLAVTGALLVTAAMIGVFYKDAAPAIAGIAATEYPGQRSQAGGDFWLPDFGSHFFAPFEHEFRYPPSLLNISEAAGFFWLAPVTLLAWGAMRALSKERKVFLVCLWIPSLLLLGWDTLQIPASFGRWLLLDKVTAERTLAAMGLLNVAIVAVVLSAPEWRKKVSIDAKMTIAIPATIAMLAVVNSLQDDYFTWKEILLISVWLVPLTAFLWDGRAKAFMATAIVPSVLFFGLINPVSRGTGAITSSPLFELANARKDLRKGRWLVFAPNVTYGIFAAAGLDSYTGMHYLPHIEDFAIFRKHGLDLRILNQGGMSIVKPLAAGKPSTVESPAPGTVIWSVNPNDAIVKELGVRYIAFESMPEPSMVEGWKRVVDEPVSGFWLYERAGR